MIESHPVPKIAMTAFGLLKQQYEQSLQLLGVQTIEAAGLTGTYRVDFDRGTISREVPDIAPKAEVMSG